MNNKNGKIDVCESDADGKFGCDSDSNLDSDAEFGFLLCYIFRA